VVEPGDPGAMAEALIAVLGASSAERGHLGTWLRNRALTLFTAQRMFDDYDDVYTGILARSRSAGPGAGDATPDLAPPGTTASDRAMAHAVS
jgi:hypothetical protein